MDLSSFFGVVSTVDFALLGLWWVAVQARPDLRGKKTSRMSYLVSMQFSVPGASALLAQVAPQLSAVWRISFAVAGLVGAVSILLLVPTLARNGGQLVPKLMLLGGLPLYVIIAILALIPSHFYAISSRFGAIQVEAVFFCLMAFMGTQIAWAAAMSSEVKVDAPVAPFLEVFFSACLAWRRCPARTERLNQNSTQGREPKHGRNRSSASPGHPPRPRIP